MADNAASPTNETAPADAAAREQAIRELTLAEVKKIRDGFTKDQWQNMPRERRSKIVEAAREVAKTEICLLYTSPSPRDQRGSRMPSSA